MQARWDKTPGWNDYETPGASKKKKDTKGEQDKT